MCKISLPTKVGPGVTRYSPKLGEGEFSEAHFCDPARHRSYGAESVRSPCLDAQPHDLHVVALDKGASACTGQGTAAEEMPVERGCRRSLGRDCLRQGSFPDPSVHRNPMGRLPSPLLPYPPCDTFWSNAQPAKGRSPPRDLRGREVVADQLSGRLGFGERRGPVSPRFSGIQKTAREIPSGLGVVFWVLVSYVRKAEPRNRETHRAPHRQRSRGHRPETAPLPSRALRAA